MIFSDIENKPIGIGDKIVCNVTPSATNKNILQIGTVTGFTNSKVRIEDSSVTMRKSILKDPNQIYVIKGNK